MFFVINYDIKERDREDTFLKTAKGMGDTLAFLPHSILMYFKDGTQSKDTLFSSFKSVLVDDDLIFISEVPFSNMAGWLPSSSVEWLSSHNHRPTT